MKIRFLMIAAAMAMIGTAAADAREPGSGMATGRRDYKVKTVKTVKAGPLAGISAAQATTVVSPRDAASGLATGKRMHKPIVKQMPFSKVAVPVKVGALRAGARVAAPVAAPVAAQARQQVVKTKSNVKNN